MAKTEAYITPQVLEWARLRYFQMPEEAAEKLKIPVDKYKSWEDGSEHPTFRQAQMLSARLHVPLGYFFLPTPPKIELPLPDLRTKANEPPGTPSPDFLEVVQDALLKQQWYRDYQEANGSEHLDFVGKFRTTDEPILIAEYIRARFALDEVLEDATDRATFIRLMTRRIENAGILVLRSRVVGANQNRKLDVREFRGFVISDTLAPLLFINAQDFEGAQIFTFAHELAHIVTGVTGVSNPNYRRGVGQQYSPIENNCDKVAAEILMPAREFHRWWSEKKSIDDNLTDITRHYKASTIATLRRANELGKISDTQFWARFDELQKREWRPKPDDGDGGGDPYATLFVRNSRRLTETIIEAVAEGSLLYLDAASMLGVRVQTLNEAARRLFGAPLHA